MRQAEDRLKPFWCLPDPVICLFITFPMWKMKVTIIIVRLLWYDSITQSQFKPPSFDENQPGLIN